MKNVRTTGAALFASLALLSTAPAQSADLGGNCCADLEERIAELEATAARKGNRKVSLTISGQVNAGLLYLDVGDYNNTKVTGSNGNEETFVGFYGRAVITQGVVAGYVLELDARKLGLLDSGLSSNEPRTRQSYWYLKSDTLGALSVGRTAQATHAFDEITTANTVVAAKPFSLGGISDDMLTGLDIPFDGRFRDVLRYDSPTLQGFVLSASWGSSQDLGGTGDTWDIALRYQGEFSGFKLAGGVGYRRDTDFEINALNIINVALPTGDVNTILAVGSIMHVTSGLFLTANWADQDWKDLNFKIKGWSFTGGIEQKWTSLGKTTLYGEYGRITLDAGSSTDFDYAGLGLVQAIDAAAMDLYLTGRRIDLGSENADVITAGARIRF